MAQANRIREGGPGSGPSKGDGNFENEPSEREREYARDNAEDDSPVTVKWDDLGRKGWQKPSSITREGGPRSGRKKYR